MGKYNLITFSFAAVFFLIFGTSFYLVNDQNGLRKIAFDYFGPKQPLHILKFLVALNPLFSVPFNIIAIIEIFEKVSAISVVLKGSDGKLSARKIFMMRVVLLSIIFLFTLISTNIAVIFDLVGSVFGPILGLLLPVKKN